MPKADEGSLWGDTNVAREIAERSITLVRDTHGLFPLHTSNIATVIVNPHGDSLDDALRALGSGATGSQPVGSISRVAGRAKSPSPQTNQAVHPGETGSQPVDSEQADVLLLLLAIRPKSGAGTIAVPDEIQRLAQRHAHKTIAIAFGSPYVLRELGEISTFVCAWGVQPLLQIAAMRAIRGEIAMKGKLPVRIE